MSRTGVAEKLHEGWLTKSPPSNRIIRCRWRKRWFSLHCGELPGQYQLTYYTDRNCRKLKGVIDLDRCEQVDIGLKYEDKKLKFDHMLSIKTPSRTYYLAADSEQEMKNWVKFICEVCNLKSSDEEDTPYISSLTSLPPIEASNNVNSTSANGRESTSSSVTVTPTNSAPMTPLTPTTSPYIHISECVTGRSPIDGPSYLNISQDFWYDQPRSLQAPSSMANYCNLPPPHSPAGSDAVFEEDGNIGVSLVPTQRMDVTVDLTQIMPPPPPRPPKPTSMPSPRPNYFNLNQIPQGDKLIVQDDLYDFPRAHQIETGEQQGRRHCYNNAAPADSKKPHLVGEVFTYDNQWAITSKTAQPSDAINVKFEATPLNDSTTSVDQPIPITPTTPNSQCPSSNPSTPLLPPVHRDLKPPAVTQQRKLSETSVSGDVQQTQPTSPAPIVDRKKKPTLLLLPDVTQVQQTVVIRAAPSPQPPHLGAIGKPCETLLHSDFQSSTTTTMLEYLDLDKTILCAGVPPSDDPPVPRSPSATTVYKEVDFIKTNAFNKTRDNLEKEKLEKQHHIALANKK